MIAALCRWNVSFFLRRRPQGARKNHTKIMHYERGERVNMQSVLGD